MESGCLHPVAARMVSRMAGVVDDDYIHGWGLRMLPSLNEVLERTFGQRLQVVEMFAGIGGLGAGLEAALDAVTVMQAEFVPERRRVLAHHFPLALQLDDVHRLLGMPAPCPSERLVIAGGFPCRGMSQANLTGLTGFAHPQTGLWAVMLEVIRRWRPIAVVWENVVGLRSRGLREVLQGLHGTGYDVLWGVARASDYGAPHERARLFGVGVQRNARPSTITPRAYKPAWLPWSKEIPANDHRAAARRPRVAALGDCVVPIVGWHVGLAAASLLGGWRPETPGSRAPREIPMNGWMAEGRIWQLPSSPFVPVAQVTDQRWVVVDERYESPGTSVDLLSYPPAVGRIAWWDGESDNVDVELPGGEIMPFPPEWVREKPWPTPTANDGKNKGSSRQLTRNAPGINALCQTDCWIGGEECPVELLLEYFSGRGAGPGLLEWMQGFPPGWTAPMAADLEEEERLREALARRLCLAA